VCLLSALLYVFIIEELFQDHPPAVSGQPVSDLVISGDLMKSGQAHSEMGKT
jgi:hypothetical protein